MHRCINDLRILVCYTQCRHDADATIHYRLWCQVGGWPEPVCGACGAGSTLGAALLRPGDLGRITPAVGNTSRHSRSFAAVSFTNVSASMPSTSMSLSQVSICFSARRFRASSSWSRGGAAACRASSSRAALARARAAFCAAVDLACISRALSRVNGGAFGICGQTTLWLSVCQTGLRLALSIYAQSIHLPLCVSGVKILSFSGV